jgi:hypothetical protein
MAGLPADLEALPSPVLPRLPAAPRLLLGLGLLPLLGLLLAAQGLDAAKQPCDPVESVDYASGARGTGGGCGLAHAAAKGVPAAGVGLAASAIVWVDQQAGPRRRWLAVLQAGLATAGVSLAILATAQGWPGRPGAVAAGLPLLAMAAVAVARTWAGWRGARAVPA